MPNQYLYLSSKNSDDHADFNCDLPNGLRVSPYSQLRVKFIKYYSRRNRSL